MIPREQIERRDFSYVSISYVLAVEKDRWHPFGIDHATYKIIVGSPFKGRAEEVARAYALMRWERPPTEIHVYPRNYIRDARAMVAAGECVQA